MSPNWDSNKLENINRYQSENGIGTITDHVKIAQSSTTSRDPLHDGDSQQHNDICRGSLLDLQVFQ
eukprot:279757-Amphidinium_carterae.3